jgi:hypothetical protein
VGLKIRVCGYGGSCESRLEPVADTDGMLSQRICDKPFRTDGYTCVSSTLIDVDDVCATRGVQGYSGGFRPSALLVLGRKFWVDFLPSIQPSEYWILFNWARDFSGRNIPFFVLRRKRGVALYKRMA